MRATLHLKLKITIITQESEIVRDAPKTIKEAYHLLNLFRNPPVVKSPTISTVTAPAKSSIAAVALVATDNRGNIKKESVRPSRGNGSESETNPINTSSIKASLTRAKDQISQILNTHSSLVRYLGFQRTEHII